MAGSLWEGVCLRSLARGFTTKVKGDPGQVLGHAGASGLCRLWVSAFVETWPRGFQTDETCCVVRFQEMGGKSRQIMVRQDLELAVRAYLEVAGIDVKNGGRWLLRSKVRWMQ